MSTSTQSTVSQDEPAREGSTLWIGPLAGVVSIGAVAFLVEHSPTNRRTVGSDFHLSSTPAHTNQSHEPRLNGWCGTWNEMATHAHGIAEVVRVAKNGRVLVRSLDGPALEAALDSLGYPELKGQD